MASRWGLAWRRLPIPESQNSRSPRIFFRLQRHEKGLKVQTTDLVYVWTAAKTSLEELKQEAIRTRCSIDPSEDQEQLEILISKIEEAMSGRNRGRVRLIGDGDASSPVSFNIEASIPLPTPLGMLEWTFRMVREEPPIFTSELVLPALQVIEKSTESKQGLLRKIKEKDHVIGKLMDKIEGAGIDLSMVFPGFATARKGLTAKQAAQVVPGIEPFRGDEWVKQGNDGDDDEGVREIVEALRDPKIQEMMWDGSTTSVMASNRNQSSGLRHAIAQKGSQNQQNSVKLAPVLDHNCDFSLTSIRNTEASHESGSSGSSPDSVRGREATPKPSRTTSRKLGNIKGKSATLSKQKSSSASPELHAKASGKPSSISPDTVAELVIQSDTGSAESAARFQPPTAKNPISKMGIIGGRKTQSMSGEKAKSAETLAASISRSTLSRNRSRPGAIGGKEDEAAGPSAHEHDSAASPILPPASEPPSEQLKTDQSGRQTHSPSTTEEQEPLTEADRANRKRLELKRQLDQGAGKKKKRKF